MVNDKKYSGEFDPKKAYDVKVFKESILKAIEIEEFCKELMKPLSVSDIKDIAISFYDNSMKLIAEAKRAKAGMSRQWD